MGILTKHGALADLNVIHIYSSSACVTGFNQIVSLILVPRLIPKYLSIEGILFVRLIPVLIKYLQNLSAISFGSEKTFSSVLNCDGSTRFCILLFITSLISFQVPFMMFLTLTN